MMMVMLGKSGGSEGKEQTKQSGRDNKFHISCSPVPLATRTVPHLCAKSAQRWGTCSG
jgi:hypothetical protein